MSRIPLTKEDRDLNRQVAIALGWRELKPLKIQSRNSLLLEGISPKHSQASSSGFRNRQYVPNFAGDMNAALEILDELHQRGFHSAALAKRISTQGGSSSQLSLWECFLEDPLGRRVAECAGSPAQAICKALLNALQLVNQAASA